MFSPTQIRANLLRRAVLRCRSTALVTILVLAPVNHWKKGLFESSRTLSHGFDHSSSWACSSQYAIGPALALPSSVFQSETQALSTMF